MTDWTALPPTQDFQPQATGVASQGNFQAGQTPVIQVPGKKVPIGAGTSLSQIVKQGGTNTLVDQIVAEEGGSPHGVSNNPGNIKFTGLSGQTDSGVKAKDGGTFASYASPEAGRQAIADLITNAASGKSQMYGADPTVESFKKIYQGKDGQPVYSAKGFSVSPSSISQAQAIPDSSTVYADPALMLALLPATDQRSKSLDKSLAAGDQIQEIPSIDVGVKDGVAKITDYDGRRRLQAAVDAGVNMVPVSVRGIGDSKIKELEGLTGKKVPFDFS